jgi:4-amino-4-deoxy-L-arabinose transferase-like glycosyltransferase
MVLLFPLLLAAAGVIAWQRRENAGGTGRRWFSCWAGAGFLFGFSFVTGLSIGVFIFPFAAVLLIWTAMRSPHLLEAAGFLAGVAATAVVVAVVSLSG